jgi:putative mRNA 3-end processing factor
VSVRLRDGIEVTLSDGTRVVCDGDQPDGDVNVVSHAHGDHTPTGEATAVCSPLTAALATTRRDVPLHRATDDRVKLLPAGHVAGSRAALITDPDGTRYLYTGDVCTRPRFYLEGFEPPSADVLILEATYGEPQYVFPDHPTVAEDIRTWLAETDQPVLLFGYALGRAQKLQLLAGPVRDRVFTTSAVAAVNNVIAEHLDVSFPSASFDDDVTLSNGDALVVPITTTRIDWIDALREEVDAATAGFSGWAVEDSFRYRGGYDVTFPLSDHCDFRELEELVGAVDPERVYTQHGAAGSLTTALTRMGYDATALRQDQTALDEF